jgi:hypothetical protein
MKIKNFIKNISRIKEKNELDLSAGEDLSIALMNLVSLEEHAYFSYIKTQDDRFLSILENVRETRKRLLKLIVKEDDSEKWCMSKHLLASSMRLYEVGNRMLHEGKTDEASGFYKDSAELYGLFWKINTDNKDKLIDNKRITEKKEKPGIFNSIKKMLECCKE